MQNAATYLVLVLSAGITIFAMMRAAAGSVSAGTIGFIAWAVAPYLIFGILVFMFSRSERPRVNATVVLAAAAAMLVMTGYTYLWGMDGTSSTEALVFVFLPGVLLAVAFVALAIAFVAARGWARRA